MRWLFALALWLLVAPAAHAQFGPLQSTPYAVPPLPASTQHRGIWVVAQNANAALTSSIMQALLINPYIDGFSLVQTWPNFEPTQGGYQWALFDAPLAVAKAAGKKVLITLLQHAFATPQWVYDAGVTYFATTDYTNSGSCLEAMNIPYPWDATYQGILDTLIGDLARHYDGQVEAVKFIGAGYDTGEQGYPTNLSGQSLTCSSGPNAGMTVTVPQLNSAWATAGYTATKMKSGMTAILNSYVTYWHKSYVIMMIRADGRNAPSINEVGAVVPTFDGMGGLVQGFGIYTNYVESTIVPIGFQILGQRFGVQFNGLEAAAPWADNPLSVGGVIARSIGAMRYFMPQGSGNQQAVAVLSTSSDWPGGFTGATECAMNDGHVPCVGRTVLGNVMATAVSTGQFVETFPGDVVPQQVQASAPSVDDIMLKTQTALWRGFRR